MGASPLDMREGYARVNMELMFSRTGALNPSQRPSFCTGHALELSGADARGLATGAGRTLPLPTWIAKASSLTCEARPSLLGAPAMNAAFAADSCGRSREQGSGGPIVSLFKFRGAVQLTAVRSRTPSPGAALFWAFNTILQLLCCAAP